MKFITYILDKDPDTCFDIAWIYSSGRQLDPYEKEVPEDTIKDILTTEFTEGLLALKINKRKTLEKIKRYVPEYIDVCITKDPPVFIRDSKLYYYTTENNMALFSSYANYSQFLTLKDDSTECSAPAKDVDWKKTPDMATIKYMII